MSETRKRYMFRLIMRCIALILGVVLCIYAPSQFDVIEKGSFFKRLSWLHLMWIVWVADMFLQIVPVRNKVALGSMKLFEHRFRPILEKVNFQALRNYVVTTTKAAYKVFLLWTILIIVIGILHYYGVISKVGLLMISLFFYVCDLICVLIWCPFRLIMKNKCCTTCRIFNWDHLMMFTPLIYVPGFYARSLLIMAIIAWLVWELCVMMYPERFCEMTNAALKCSECTDKLCTQYCQKLRTSSVQKENENENH